MKGKIKTSTARKGGLEKILTGITGFDEVLDGGVPKGRVMLVTGTTGTGKTVFLNEFLYRGITQLNENGVYVTFEETPKDIIKNVRSFGWKYISLIRKRKLAFVDASPAEEMVLKTGPQYDLSPLVKRIEYAIGKVKAKRVVVDSIDAIFSRFSNKDVVRAALYQISAKLKKSGVTVLISAEKTGEELSRYGVGEFVADGVIELELIKGQQQFIRKVFIKKLRGMGYRSGIVEFEISEDGFKVFPKIPVQRLLAKTDFQIRKTFGIEKLDELLGGGIPQGHIAMISGNTGTGKTVLAMQFIVQGIKEGENTIFIVLEEPIDQVKKTALEHGWDFEQYEKQGKLAFVATSLIDISNDKLLYQILNAVNRIGAKRVVIDSISNLVSATMNEEQARQFLIQISSVFKEKGITCIMNCLSGANFGAVKGQLLSNLITNEMRLSSITDGIIMLLYVERGQSVKKMLNVLKLRGSAHSREIFRYEIGKGGVKIGEKYEE
ncbi:MAG: circadian clock protein KaiC [Thermodesulfobacteriota bacterium]